MAGLLRDWRGEIDDRRELFLSLPGANRELIEKKYLDAKARERAALAGWSRVGSPVWDHAPAQTYSRAFRQERIVGEKMAATIPTTVAGCAALLDYAVSDLENGETSWHAPTLATVVEALERLAGGANV